MPATEVVSDAQIIRVEYDPSQAPESGLDLVSQAAALTVASQADADLAGELSSAIAVLEKRITAHYDPMATTAHKLHRQITSARAEMLKPLTEAKRRVAGGIQRWITAEEVKRRRAEAEALRIQREQEAERQRAEAKALAEAEEARAIEQRRVDAEKLALAEKLSVGGVEDDAALEAVDAAIPDAELVVAPIAEPPPVAYVPTEAPKVAGMRSVKRWDYRVTDMKLLCALIGSGRAPTNLVEPKRSACLAFAKMHGAEGDLPGLRMFETSTLGRKG